MCRVFVETGGGHCGVDWGASSPRYGGVAMRGQPLGHSGEEAKHVSSPYLCSVLGLWEQVCNLPFAMNQFGALTPATQ